LPSNKVKQGTAGWRQLQKFNYKGGGGKKFFPLSVECSIIVVRKGYSFFTFGVALFTLNNVFFETLSTC